MKKSIKNWKTNRSNFMWLLSLTIVLSLVISEVNGQTGKVNFSGTWVFNESKSNLGDGGGRFGGGDMVVKQEANLLTMERTRTNQNGEKQKQPQKLHWMEKKVSMQPAGVKANQQRNVRLMGNHLQLLQLQLTMVMKGNLPMYGHLPIQKRFQLHRKDKTGTGRK